MIDRSIALSVLRQEAEAILNLRIGPSFARAVELLLWCDGRVFLTGMGKSGIVCQKIAATLSSTGTPAMFLHAADALHGDLGMVQYGDAIIAISQSGETSEVVQLMNSLSHLALTKIVITGDPSSSLAAMADAVIECRVVGEACPMNLVPTTSTTAALALGDALAITLLVAKGFRPEDFAERHPGGRLGERATHV